MLYIYCTIAYNWRGNVWYFIIKTFLFMEMMDFLTLNPEHFDKLSAGL
jgi:hypothetical protein